MRNSAAHRTAGTLLMQDGLSCIEMNNMFTCAIRTHSPAESDDCILSSYPSLSLALNVVITLLHPWQGDVIVAMETLNTPVLSGEILMLGPPESISLGEIVVVVVVVVVVFDIVVVVADFVACALTVRQNVTHDVYKMATTYVSQAAS